MLNMNECNVLTKDLGLVDGSMYGEYYSLSLLELKPFYRAIFFEFMNRKTRYIFTMDEIKELEKGILPDEIGEWIKGMYPLTDFIEWIKIFICITIKG